MTQNVETDAAFFQKIEKLLALSKNAGEGGEHVAHAAAAKVQALLQERGLTLAHIEARGSSSDSTQQARDKTTTDRRALYLWQQKLMEALAGNNFCIWRLEEVMDKDPRGIMRKSRRHMLIGRPMNIKVTLFTYDYLASAIRRMAGEQGFGHAEREKEHHAFLDGAVERLSDRLRDLRREREEEDERRAKEQAATSRHPSAAPTTPGTDIVLADVYGSEEELNLDKLNGWTAGTTHAKRLAREQEVAAAAVREEKRAAVEAELTRIGVPWPKSFYLSHGYADERSQGLHDEYHANEAKAKRRRTSSGGRSYRESAKDQAEYERRASPAYRAGSEAGARVSLNQQIDSSKKRIK